MLADSSHAGCPTERCRAHVVEIIVGEQDEIAVFHRHVLQACLGVPVGPVYAFLHAAGKIGDNRD